ncbi:MAG: SPASM domain-containing protein [Planctomycetes bacterium]|nr:SPASM domain-containing protein [Planctomycetota bacterium]
MRLSRYTLFYDNFPAPDESLAYNTRTQGIAVVGQELKEVLEHLPQNGNLSDETYQLLNQLADSGLLVNDDADEDKILEQWLDGIKHASSKFTAMLLTTYNCNLACEYCFEESVKRHLYMNDDVTFRTLEYLKQEITRRHPQKVRLIFYGGEPFLNPVPIMAIGEELGRFVKEKGIKRFSFGAITNGTSINTALIGELRQVGLTNLRITLDGTSEIHNKRRPFRNGYGTFDEIVQNIEAVSDIVRVDIAANFDRTNTKSLIEMMDWLKARGLDQKIGTLLLAPVMARMGVEASAIEQTGCSHLSGELMAEGLELRRAAIARGFRVQPATGVNGCPMTQDGSMLVIDPQGDIYKCAGFVGRAEFCIGNIADKQLNHRHTEFMAMHSALDEPDCRKCVYLPMCSGGCRFSAQLRHQDYTRISCEKPYYEQAFPEMLKMDYARGALAT